MKKIAAIAFGLVFSFLAAGQGAVNNEVVTDPPKNWFNLDPVADRVNGVSTEKAYELLKDRTSQAVIVAIIDSGIDIEHEDLKDVIWTNPGEIAGNGIDDDGNGYIDDIHGWNFLGGKDGRNVNYETLEVTRIYKKLSAKYEGKSQKEVPKSDRDEYEQWLKIKGEFEEAYVKAKQELDLYEDVNRFIQRYTKLFEAYLDTDVVTYEKIKNVSSNDAIIELSQRHMLAIYDATDENMTLEELRDAIEADMESIREPANYSYNLEYDLRAEIVQDDPNKLDEVGYGNNDVIGKDTDNFHGTHVAGIVAASRGNDLGIDGVANNVQIMAIRAVPQGDETDKDVANAIRYAVDNGARVVNMSFGKGYSPNQGYVSEAIEYAASKGVLLVHAAGNSAQDIDKNDNFPNDNFGSGKNWSHWIEVGASSWGEADDYIGSFSNYGKKNVDLFAPGVAIYSTAPENEYADAQGTSMASPVVSGVAALLLSYFPDLEAEQVKDILMRSVRSVKGLKVTKPGEAIKEVDFSKLSVSGGIINAYEAVKLAMSMEMGTGK